MSDDGQSIFLKTGDVVSPTVTHEASVVRQQSEQLIRRYEDWLTEKRHSWTTHLRLLKKLGSGGQGVVYLTERRGADDFTLPVAIKIFSPERYESPADYDADMARMARVAARVARIQHENLLQVENFLDRDRIRMMVMEWVEGFDIRRLLTPKMFGVIKDRVSQKRWQYINDVLVTPGHEQPRFKAGVAVAIVRDCLEALSAMHRLGLVHGDVKPGNIMLKRSGHAKMIDIGSAFEVSNPPLRRACTPAYASVEVLEGADCTPLDDLTSLGYVMLELIAGRHLFSDIKDWRNLVKAKKELWEWLPPLLPQEVVESDMLMTFCRGLTDPVPERRYQSAEDAAVDDDGAAAFHRQLIKDDLATEYDHDIGLWIDELLEIQELAVLEN